MRRVWAVATTELSVALQGRQSWLYLLVVPALVIYLAGLGAHEMVQRLLPVIRIDVLDADRSPASQALADALAGSNPSYVLCRSYGEQPQACDLAGAPLTTELAAARLADETVSATIAIPQRFGAALAAGTPVTLDFRPGAAAIAPDMVLWSLRAAVTELAGPTMAAQLSISMLRSLEVEVSPTREAAVKATAQAAWGNPQPVTVTTELLGANDKLALGAQVLSSGFRVSVPSVTAMFVMISILGLAQSLAEERLLGLLRRIGTMPVRRGEWLAGKLAATALLGLAQVVVLLGFGALLGVRLGQPGAVLVVSAAYVLAVTALAVALAGAARTPQQASAYATIAWLVLVPLGGGWWPLAFVPGWLRVVGRLSPVAWYLDGLNAVILSGGGWGNVLIPAAVLLLFAAVFFLVGMARLDFRQAGGDRGLGSPYLGGGGERATWH